MRPVYVITHQSPVSLLVGVYTNLKKVHDSLANRMDTPPDYPSLVADFKNRSPENITIKDYRDTTGKFFTVYHMLPNSMP